MKQTKCLGLPQKHPAQLSAMGDVGGPHPVSHSCSQPLLDMVGARAGHSCGRGCLYPCLWLEDALPAGPHLPLSCPVGPEASVQPSFLPLTFHRRQACVMSPGSPLRLQLTPLYPSQACPNKCCGVYLCQGICLWGNATTTVFEERAAAWCCGHTVNKPGQTSKSRCWLEQAHCRRMLQIGPCCPSTGCM